MDFSSVGLCSVFYTILINTTIIIGHCGTKLLKFMVVVTYKLCTLIDFFCIYLTSLSDSGSLHFYRNFDPIFNCPFLVFRLFVRKARDDAC